MLGNITPAAILGGAKDVLNVGAGLYNIFSNERARHDNATWQRKAWEREDNAVQRRVSDLVSAGLSPVLAAGTPAMSTQGVHSNPTQVGNVDTGALMAIRINNAQFDALKAQEDKARADIANNARLTSSTVQKTAQDIKESQSRIGINAQTVKQIKQTVNDMMYNRRVSESGEMRTSDKESDEFRILRYLKEFLNRQLETPSDKNKSGSENKSGSAW